MDPAGFSNFSGGVDLYHESGRAYTLDERRNIAKRKGICVSCGVKTHQKKTFRKEPLTNDEVWKGVCLRCFPEQAPAEAVDAYKRKIGNQSGRGLGTQPPSSSSLPNSPVPASNRPPTGAGGSPASDRPPLRFTSSPSTTPGSSRRTVVTSAGTVPTRPQSAPGRSRRNNLSRLPRMNERSSASNASLSTSTMGESSTAVLNVSDSSLSGGGISPHPSSTSSHQNITARVTRLPQAPDLAGASHHSEESSYSMELDVAASGSSAGSSRHQPQPPQKSSQFSSSEEIVEAITNAHKQPDQLEDVLDKIRCLPAETCETVIGLDTVIDAIAEIVYGNQNEKAVLRAAFGAIWRINVALLDNNNSSDEQQQQDAQPGIMVQSGVCGMLVDHLRRHCSSPDDKDLCEWALGALASLCQDSANRAAVVEADGVNVVLETLQHHGEQSAGLFEWASRCLHEFVCASAAAADGDESRHAAALAIVDEGEGVALIVRSMAHHKKESQALLWAIEVLWCLSAHSEDAGQNRVLIEMAKNDFLDLGAYILKSRSASSSLFLRATELLARVLLISDDASPLSRSISAVVRVVSDPKEDIAMVSAGCRLLASLANGNEASRDQLRESGLLLSIITVLTRHSGSLVVAETGSWIIYKLCQDAPIATKDADKIVETLLTLVNQHGHSGNLVLSCCGCVGKLVESLSADGSGAAYQILERAGASFMEDPAVRGQVVDTIFSLSQLDPYRAETFFNSIDLAVLVCEFPRLTGQNLINACHLIGKVASRSPVARKKLASAETLESLAETLRDETEESLQRALLSLIAVVVFSDPLKTIDLPQGLIQGVARFVMAVSTPDRVVMTACIALRNLILVSAAPFHAPGLADSLWKVISSQDVEVAAEGCGVLWALSKVCPAELDDKTDMAFRSVVEVFAKHCSEASVYHKELLSVSAAAFANVTQLLRFSNPIEFDTDDVDAVVSAVYKILENEVDDDSVLSYLLIALDDLYHVRPDVMVHVGLMVVVIDIMVDREKSVVVNEIGCRILSQLSSISDLQVRLSIIQTDGLDLILSALSFFKDNARIQSYGCKAFSYLCIEDESKHLVVSQNGLGICASATLLHEDDQDLQSNVWRALATLTTVSSLEEGLIVGTGLVEAAVRAMSRFPLVENIQAACLEVLLTVSSSGPGVRRLMVNSGVVKCIVAAIEEFIGNKLMLKHALGILDALVADGEHGDQFEYPGSGRAVLTAMMASIDNEDTQVAACKALSSLASFDKENLTQSGGPDVLFCSLQIHNLSYPVQTAGFRALANVTSGKATGLPIVVTEGQVQQVLGAMKRFPGLPSVQGDACSVLRNLMYWPENLHVMKGIKAQLQSALEKAAGSCPSTCRETAEQALIVLQTA